MARQQDSKQHLDNELGLMRQQVEQLEQELQTQKKIAFAAGIFQGDVTVRTLLEALAEGVIVCDQGGTIVLINRRAEELFGYQLDEVVGHSLNIYLPERFFTTHTKHIEGFFKDLHVRPMGQGLDLTGKRKDGSEIPIEVSLSFLHTEAGILGLAFVTDITARKQAEWALRLRNEELDAFARTVAHDLKTSLAALIGYSEVLADTHMSLSESEQDEYIMALAMNGRRMSNIIDELLVFSSIRREDIAQYPLRMDIIVDNTIQRLNYMMKEYGARVTVPDSYQMAMGYAPWVEEVWYNYLANAIKYGGSPPIIEIGSEVRENYVKFWVKDNGQGLTKNEQRRLFEPFTQLKPQKFEGHGLGLSIVKKIVEKLNGRVEVESEVGKGSTFSFYLTRDYPQTSTSGAN
ncbi:MAG: PAS domain-containing sensor histidine kinase [Caldilineales bacterium]|nr:PAS domain-containing sensor histidine kinase [Caldilineales bacterium]